MMQKYVPEKYWDYAVELAVKYLNCTATWKLGWKTPEAVHFGETPDISFFLICVL